jgi:hypothetical protein
MNTKISFYPVFVKAKPPYAGTIIRPNFELIWAHFRRFAPETGLSAPIFCAGGPAQKYFRFNPLRGSIPPPFLPEKKALKTAVYDSMRLSCTRRVTALHPGGL